jgi:hypothetical protein
MFTVTADQRKIQELMMAIKNLSPQKLDKVLVRAINRTATMARTAIIRKFKERSTLNSIKIWDASKVVRRHKPIDERVLLHKASSAASGAGISIDHSRVSLIAFGATQDKKIGGGVSYEVSKTSGRKTIVSSFINRGIGGTEGVFRRRRGVWLKGRLGIVSRATGKLDRKKWGRDYTWWKEDNSKGLVPRYPISLLRGPSLRRMFTGVEDMAAEIIDDSEQRMHKHIIDQIKLITERRKGAVA